MLEKVERGLLEQIAGCENFSEQDANLILAIILKTLSFVHEKGVVHRDIRPENIIVVKNAQGQDIVKLTGFAGKSKYYRFGQANFSAPEVVLD